MRNRRPRHVRRDVHDPIAYRLATGRAAVYELDGLDCTGCGQPIDGPGYADPASGYFHLPTRCPWVRATFAAWRP